MSVACRTSHRSPARQRVVGTALALALVVSACGDDEPIATPAAEATTTLPTMPVSETTTTTSAVGPEPADAPQTSTAASTDGSPDHGRSNGAREAGGSFVGEPSWSEILDVLDATEQSCIRDVLDEAGLDEAGRESAMSRRLFSDDFPMAEDAAMFACLAADTANDIFVTYQAAGIQSDFGVEVSDSERACLRDWLTDIGLATLFPSSSGSPDDLASALVALGVLADCMPDGFARMLFADTGVRFDELSEDEKTCAREVLAGTDWDIVVWEGDADAAFSAFSFATVGCVPELMESVGAQPGGVDDHPDSEAGATVAAVGERIEAEVDYDGDTDFFVFEAVEGETYDIEALPGTLEYLRLLLFDADGAVLDADIGPLGPGDSPPLLRWEALSTGSHYVAVESYAFGFYGSYSLTITRR